LSVNDAFVMHAWGEQHNAEAIDMMGDGNADFVTALGLDMDSSGRGMGTRSRRFAFITEDAKVRWIGVEEPGQFEKSSAEAVMAALQELS
jgi:peroxiredoxin